MLLISEKEIRDTDAKQAASFTPALAGTCLRIQGRCELVHVHAASFALRFPAQPPAEARVDFGTAVGRVSGASEGRLVQ